jgi:hypothetical protein
MADIYENAFVTVAATCAANSDDGLRPFRDRFKAHRLGSSNFFVREWISDGSRTYQSRQNKFWPLLLRAWAFQESQLAPRTLRFSCHGVIWDCRTTRVRQEEQRVGRKLGDDTVDLLPFFLLSDRMSSPKKAWHNTIREYSIMDLTYRTDTLPAIAALAQRMARLRRNDAYLAGMWRSTLLSDIQWQTEFSRTPCQESALPTWSWATTQRVFYAAGQKTLHSVEILSLDYTPVGPAEIGAIKDAILTIRGPTLSLQVQAQHPLQLQLHASDSFHWLESSILHQAAFWSDWRIGFSPDHISSLDFYLDGRSVFLALIIGSNRGTPYGLILRQVETVYERAGWFFLGTEVPQEDTESLMEHLARLLLTTIRII